VSTCTARRLTGLEQRALAGAGSRWDGGGAIAVMEKRLGKPVTGTAMAGSRRRGCSCCGRVDGEGGAGNAKLRARLSAGGCWGGNAGLRRVVAYAVRAMAMRGQRDLHAAAQS